MTAFSGLPKCHQAPSFTLHLQLTFIELPAGLMIICGGAFTGCSSMTSIKLPNGLTSLGEDAFYGYAVQWLLFIVYIVQLTKRCCARYD